MKWYYFEFIIALEGGRLPTYSTSITISKGIFMNSNDQSDHLALPKEEKIQQATILKNVTKKELIDESNEEN